MKLDVHVTFEPGVRDIQVSTRNSQINTVSHTHAPASRDKSIIAIDINVSIDQSRSGRQKSSLTMRTDRCGFTFMPVDLLVSGVIWVRELGVRITLKHHELQFTNVPGISKLQAISVALEPSFNAAASQTQDVKCPTLLGMGLDNRQFLIDTDVQTLHAVTSVRNKLRTFRIPIGRGKAVQTNLYRRLEQDYLPILLADKQDEDIRYSATVFVTFAERNLEQQKNRGTHFLVAEEGLGMPHTPEQIQQRETARSTMLERGNLPVVCCYRLCATNTTAYPSYAFFYVPRLYMPDGKQVDVVAKDGLLAIPEGIIGAVRIENQPWIEPQQALLLGPGETVTAEYYLAHDLLPVSTVQYLQEADFEELHADIRRYWTIQIGSASGIELPEARIQNMLYAGLAHLQLVTYGERGGTLSPCVGVYSPIGSESSPIIQFYDSMGLHDLAAQSLQYFIDKQHPDGRFQNFGDYMLETGAALYTMGEHYRYTRDDNWVNAIKLSLIKACDWIITKRHADSPAGTVGAGMIKGKVADPEDHYRQYMLNAYQYLGLARVAEMLHATDPERAAALAEEVSPYRSDIRNALVESHIKSPLVPLRDGRWVPACAPWAEAAGPDAFALDGQLSYTHEAVYARDSLLGPLYTVFAEVVEPHEQLADFMVESHYEHMCMLGAAFSQPYYSRHPMVHLKRGEVQAFLQSYYAVMAALADRETHSFWEHLFGVSPHKTHEEGWFLMETRRMLYSEMNFSMQQGGVLQLLPGIPRAYLKHGQSIHVKNAHSYFGVLDFSVQSVLDEGYVDVSMACPQGHERGLTSVQIRLPHPLQRRARSLDHHVHYNAAAETVTVPWQATNKMQLRIHY